MPNSGFITTTTFRTPNLVIVALTQVLLGIFVLYPSLRTNQIEFALSSYQFGLLILITILITASGYIINDYFDLSSDEINKPGKNRLLSIGKGKLLLIYGICLIAGFGLSYYLAVHIQKLNYLWIYLIVQLLLFSYSYKLKWVPGMGNLLVSILCAGVILILLVAEWDNLQALKTIDTNAYYELMQVFWAFIVFAFLITMSREIVKDLEDMEGDQVQGKRTLPLAFGQPVAQKLAGIFLILLVFSILAWMSVYEANIWHSVYLGIMIFGPLLFCIFLLFKAKHAADYTRISQLLKFIMLLGLVYIIFKAM